MWAVIWNKHGYRHENLRILPGFQSICCPNHSHAWWTWKWIGISEITIDLHSCSTEMNIKLTFLDSSRFDNTARTIWQFSGVSQFGIRSKEEICLSIRWHSRVWAMTCILGLVWWWKDIKLTCNLTIKSEYFCIHGSHKCLKSQIKWSDLNRYQSKYVHLLTPFHVSYRTIIRLHVRFA